MTYDTVDKFVELTDNTEILEIKIMKKYPTLDYIKHCDDNIVYDTLSREKYLIISIIL